MTTSKASIKNQTRDDKLEARLEELLNQLKQNNMSEEKRYQEMLQNIDSFRDEELHHIMKVKIFDKTLNETLNKILSKINKNILHEVATLRKIPSDVENAFTRLFEDNETAIKGFINKQLHERFSFVQELSNNFRLLYTQFKNYTQTAKKNPQ